ncbi:sorbosone dehydrogenase family protein [Pelomonas sp. Root1237]|uniref:PQQ-dependent sugar dehydrogenase n=1 Tax=Pelomonas sp. Root1237 TaxID=1736434 RepID=UPI0006F24A86|nr:PQQ-dependent sugar dehydrogenase [Pelomonas sp. Root1237]
MKLFPLATLALAAAAGPAFAATLVGSGYEQPVFLTAPSGDSRLFIVEKTGRIKVQDSGGTVSTWLNLSGQVDTGGERGLLGLAFDPGFANNGRFYVDYIDKTTLSTVVASYTVNGAGAVDLASAKTVITVAQPAGRSNHKAGWIGFSAADPGHLYVATGDGGSGNDPDNNAQNLSSNLGKLLRITPNAAGGYTVPTDNPFVGVAGNDEIWAYGLRNPYRNSFDRQTGDLWIGDVGQGAREEVDFASAASGLGRGANYGWRVREGTIATPGISDPTPPNLTEPIYDYGRANGDATVIGGYVYRGGADASLEGKYVFGDYISGRIWTLNGGTATPLASPFGGSTLTSFGEGGNGALYAVGIDGNVYLLAAAVPEPAPALLLALGLAAGSLFTRRRRA